MSTSRRAEGESSRLFTVAAVDPLTRLAMDAARGDSSATTAFIQATQRDVLRFVAYLAGPVHAEDLAQETYIRALRTLSSYRGDGPPKAWLFAVARHVVGDWLRSDMRRKEAVAEQLPDPGVPDFSGNTELRLLIAGLDQPRREAFVLTQILGIDYAQAASILDCPIGTVRSRVFRARADLAAMLGATLADTQRVERRAT
ncbi:MAG: polymerase sigma-70 factor, subfamily [Frankiaceae bacterium]|nr:polymerase sigma-70 factor, subfamily [Frankiaceae bacterium]